FLSPHGALRPDRRRRSCARTRARRRPRSIRSQQSKTARVYSSGRRIARERIWWCLPARASDLQRLNCKNVQYFGSLTTWRVREPMAFFLRGIDAGTDYWHAAETRFLNPSGAAMAIPAREIERDQNLASGVAARLACRRGGLRVTTAGVATGYVQGNLANLPQDLAADFLRFCQANPKPCPIVGVSDVGNPRIPSLGLDLDIRTD